ncbi:MAG: carboxymuconolactone decarboxylase family protein [Novosphingobium sp.]
MTSRPAETGPIPTDIAAREAHVLGAGPRIPAVPDAEVDPRSRAIVDAIRASAGAGPAGIIPEYMRVVIKHPEIFRCQMDLGTVLFKGEISARERELAVLRVGWLTQSPYEWGQHVEIAKRYGLTAEEIERVMAGSSAPGWSEHDAAVLRGTEELLADYALSDATWEVLAKSWNEAQLIEFPMMVGQYVATAFVQNSLRIPLQEGNTGLNRR